MGEEGQGPHLHEQDLEERKKERNLTPQVREGWEDGTPPLPSLSNKGILKQDLEGKEADVSSFSRATPVWTCGGYLVLEHLSTG